MLRMRVEYSPEAYNASGTVYYRGGSRIFFRRGCTRLYFNTNKPHSFFLILQNTSCIRKPQVISGGGGGGGGGGLRNPCTLPLDPPLYYKTRNIQLICTVNIFTIHVPLR